MRLDNPSISGSISYLGGGTNTISGIDAKITGSFTGSFIGEVSGTSSIATTASYIELSNVDGSASLASRIESQEDFSSSLDATFATEAELNAATASLSSSLAVDISTNSASIASLETVSGSYANSASFASDISINSASIASLETVSGSYANSASFASDISINSASIASLETVSGSYANSASFASDISSNSASIGSLNAVSSSYLLNTTDTLTGDLTVTGNIIATTLNVQDVTASVIYSSGSNIFGSSSIDTQQFTGSIQVSGSVELEDNVRLNIGNSNDLSIYHDGSHSRIDELGTGGLIAKTGAFLLRNPSDASMLDAQSGGAVNLYYNASKKLETTNTGVTFSNLSNTSAASSSVDEIKIGTFGAGRPAIYFGTSNTTYTNSTWFIENIGAAGKLRFGRNGLDVIEIFNNGNTTFAGEVSLKSRLNLQRLSGGATTLIQFKNENGVDRAHIDFGGTDEELSFFAGAGSTENMRIRSSGTIGIGGAGFDSQMLTIAAGTLDGAIYATSTDANCFASFRDNSSTANIEYGAIGNDHVFRKDTTEYMRIDSSGVISIGPSTTSSEIYFNYNNTNNKGGLKINYSTGELRLTAGESGNGYHQAFYTNGAERMRITSGGDINVEGGDLFLNSGTNYNDKGVVYFSNERTAIISDIVNATANGDTSLDFQTRKSGTRASAMFINEFRNVGIGGTPSNYKLEVQQTATTAALWVQTGGTTSSYTIADFRTGTNASALAIKGDGNATFTGHLDSIDSKGYRLKNAANTSNEGGFLRSGLWKGNSDRDPSLFAETGLSLKFYTGGSADEKMSIDSAGSIAMGNFSPSGTPTGDYRSFEIGRQGNTITGSPFKSAMYYSTNATITAGSTQFTYRNSSVPASVLLQEGGEFDFQNAPSGTATQNITFNSVLRVDANGGTFNRNWEQTGTTTGTSIVQTTLIPEPGVYEFYLRGNPNAGGSGAYTSIQAGLITIAVDYTVSQSVFLRIEKVVLAEQGGGSSNIQLNLNAYMLYNGSASDNQSIANKDASVIYLTISGYVGTIGNNQEVRITRKI
ncbi:hypothetical protein N9Z86_00015 [bacterium]|nr:hypothetical protein [bacterium]